NDVVAGNRRVDHRMTLELLRYCLEDEWQVRKLLSARRLEVLAHVRANACDTSEVDFEERGDMRCDANGERHVFGRQSTNLRHGFDAIAGPRRGHGAVRCDACRRVHGCACTCGTLRDVRLD